MGSEAIARTELTTASSMRTEPSVFAHDRQTDIARAFRAMHPDAVVFDRAGAAIYVGDRARELLAHHNLSSHRGSPLPGALAHWALGLLRRFGTRSAYASSKVRPLVLVTARSRVWVRALLYDGGLVVAIEDHTHSDAPHLRTAGLTPRENEVLFWVTEGKTNGDIATILGVTAKTIEKHLEHVYRKLDVPNRAAAVAAALETDVRRSLAVLLAGALSAGAELAQPLASSV